jgi:hypothetical protein
MFRGKIFDVLESRQNSQQAVRSKVLDMLPTMDELLTLSRKCYEGDVLATQSLCVQTHLPIFGHVLIQCETVQGAAPPSPIAVNQKLVFCSGAKIFHLRTACSQIETSHPPWSQSGVAHTAWCQTESSRTHWPHSAAVLGIRVRCHVSLNLRVALNICVPSVTHPSASCTACCRIEE